MLSKQPWIQNYKLCPESNIVFNHYLLFLQVLLLKPDLYIHSSGRYQNLWLYISSGASWNCRTNPHHIINSISTFKSVVYGMIHATYNYYLTRTETMAMIVLFCSVLFCSGRTIPIQLKLLYVPSYADIFRHRI